MAHPSVMIRRTVLSQAVYSEEYPFAEDWELWRRLLSTTRFANLQHAYVRYRISGCQKKLADPFSNNGKEKLLRENTLKLGLSESDFAIQLMISDHNVTSVETLRDIESYLIKVAAQNNRYAQYPLPAFDSEIGHQWFLCCRVAWSSGLPGWKIFRRSPLYKMGGFDKREIAAIQMRMIMSRIKRLIYWPFGFGLWVGRFAWRFARRLCRVGLRIVTQRTLRPPERGGAP